jgi:hypothetical protein
MIPVTHGAVKIDFGGAHARLSVSNLNVFDDHDLANSLSQGLGLPSPPIPGVFPVPATVSFDVEWDGALAMSQIENTSQHFKGAFLSTGATISWSADQPGFHFQSDTPPDPKANLVSVLGDEQNGVFFTYANNATQPLQGQIRRLCRFVLIKGWPNLELFTTILKRIEVELLEAK